MSVTVTQLRPADTDKMRALNALFGEAFGEPETYGGSPPGEAYLAATLAKPHVIVLVAESGPEMIGGLVAYELDKFEQARSEISIYDLAVAEPWRRQGVATALVEGVRRVARERGAWVVYVQGDYGDEPALALYDRLGTREEVLHFDIEP